MNSSALASTEKGVLTLYFRTLTLNVGMSGSNVWANDRFIKQSKTTLKEEAETLLITLYSAASEIKLWLWARQEIIVPISPHAGITRRILPVLSQR